MYAQANLVSQHNMGKEMLMGKRESQKENERFRSWTQHIYQRYSSELEDMKLDDRSRGELSDFTSRAFTDMERESLTVISSGSRSGRRGHRIKSAGQEGADSSAQQRA